jgi:hypothetical protein
MRAGEGVRNEERIGSGQKERATQKVEGLTVLTQSY